MVRIVMNYMQKNVVLILYCRSGSHNQPIWNTYMSSYYYDTCYGTRNSCPSASLTGCTHSEDITVTCSK